MSLMLDTYALIELFRGDKKGIKVTKLLKKSVKVFVSVLSLFELGYVLEREIGKEKAQDYLRSIRTYYSVVNIDEETALVAIELKRRHKLPAIDCVIYACAKSQKAKIVSGCRHFKGLDTQKDVLII